MRTHLTSSDRPGRSFAGLKFFLITLHLCIAILTCDAQPAAVRTSTNAPPSTNASASSLQKSLDPAERWYVDAIEETKRKLQDPALHELARAGLASDLIRYEAKLASLRIYRKQHEELMEAQRKTAQALNERANARMTSALSEYREMFSSIRAGHAQALADHGTNVQLWANYNEAHRKRDAQLIAKRERELADYLTKKIEKIDGKQYPTNMSLEQVMRYYQNHPSVKSNSAAAVIKQ